MNVAAIRSTGLSASLGIADHVLGLVEEQGVELGAGAARCRGRGPARDGPWWLRTARHRGVAA